MKLVMGYLQLEIPPYNKTLDPIFSHATILHEQEEHTTSTQILVGPNGNADIGLGIHCNDEKIDKIVSDIKKEKDIWRPFGNDNEINIIPKTEGNVRVFPGWDSVCSPRAKNIYVGICVLAIWVKISALPKFVIRSWGPYLRCTTGKKLVSFLDQI